MQKTGNYLELSLNGSWYALASKWLRDNGPCTREEFLVGVSKLMPTHIMHGGIRISQIALAKRALRYMSLVELPSGLIAEKPVKHNTGRVKNDALKNGYVVKSDYQDLPHFSQIASYLVKAGFLVKESKTRWLLSENIERNVDEPVKGKTRRSRKRKATKAGVDGSGGSQQLSCNGQCTA